jgi:ankyrin repeat protein
MPPLPPPEYEPGRRTLSPPPYQQTPVTSPPSAPKQQPLRVLLASQQIESDLALALQLQDKTKIQKVPQKNGPTLKEIDRDMAMAFKLEDELKVQEFPGKLVAKTLFEAAERGDAKSLRGLLETGYDVNSLHGDPPMSALQVAMANRHIECVKLILSNVHTNVNIRAMFNTSPCHIAAAEPSMLPILKLLLGDLRTLPDLEDDDLATPLIFAITKNNVPAILALIEWHFNQRANGRRNLLGLNKLRKVWNGKQSWTPLNWAQKVTRNKQVQKILADAVNQDEVFKE